MYKTRPAARIQRQHAPSRALTASEWRQREGAPSVEAHPVVTLSFSLGGVFALVLGMAIAAVALL